MTRFRSRGPLQRYLVQSLLQRLSAARRRLFAFARRDKSYAQVFSEYIGSVFAPFIALFRRLPIAVYRLPRMVTQLSRIGFPVLKACSFGKAAAQWG